MNVDLSDEEYELVMAAREASAYKDLGTRVHVEFDGEISEYDSSDGTYLIVCPDDPLGEANLVWVDARHFTRIDDEAACPNCDGRKCMACCSRRVHDKCVDDCPECCTEEVNYAGTDTVYPSSHPDDRGQL